MSEGKGSTLAIVELSHRDYLIDRYGPLSFKLLYEAFLERLANWVRSCDQSRPLGENRFLAILNGVSGDAELQLAAAKLTRLFEPPIDLLGEAVPVEVHAGFAPLEPGHQDSSSALHHARYALWQAKRSSTPCHIYDPGKNNRFSDERKFVAEIEAALELGEMRLYYQPKIHARFHSLVGTEALLRWHTSDRGVLPPNHFIPLAEKHAVIRPLTWWALKSAIARLARWPENLSTAVNITPDLLHDNEIVTIVADALSLYGITASRLTLEVTERIMTNDPVKAYAVLSQLQQLGVRISIDDFGTGFSSLAQFRDLPADELKIDQSFVIPMLKSEKNLAIVKAIIDLAHNFSLKVTAEGVETEAIAERLSELGCDILQGYLFDKPLPVELFEKRYQLQGLQRPAPAPER